MISFKGDISFFTKSICLGDISIDNTRAFNYLVNNEIIEPYYVTNNSSIIKMAFINCSKSIEKKILASCQCMDKMLIGVVLILDY